ncbi:WD40-repeat-containing domain protein, partial [Dichotomocladium elegans]
RYVDYAVNPLALTCQTYDCVPLAAALHPSQIYSVAATKCFRWVFTGSDDGYVRKWDFFASMNGKTALTQVQRHQHVDSVTMSGVLSSWWENEEQVAAAPAALPPPPTIDVHTEALWALLGTESGNINLVTVRHDEGKCHHVLRHHTGPVSVLQITPGETGVISGSWDKSVLEWDLNTGSIVRNYSGHSSQISSASFPNTSVYEEKDENIFLTTSFDGQCFIWDRREHGKAARMLGLPDKTPPWCLSACWSADGSKIYTGRRNGQVDEWDYASQKLIRSFRMPMNSGPVSYVASMPNGKHIICASRDNVRLWNTEIETTANIYPEGQERPTLTGSSASYKTNPFTILPGHHSGSISHIGNTKSGNVSMYFVWLVIDPTCRYMITTSGNRGWDGVSTNACLFYEITPIV